MHNDRRGGKSTRAGQTQSFTGPFAKSSFSNFYVLSISCMYTYVQHKQYVQYSQSAHVLSDRHCMYKGSLPMPTPSLLYKTVSSTFCTRGHPCLSKNVFMDASSFMVQLTRVLTGRLASSKTTKSTKFECVQRRCVTVTWTPFRTPCIDCRAATAIISTSTCAPKASTSSVNILYELVREAPRWHRRVAAMKPTLQEIDVTASAQEKRMPE